MASFARSLKPPTAYLSPRCRPAMPGRTLSNSSELSLSSITSAQHADDQADPAVTSAPNTPSLSPVVGAVQEDRPSSTRGSPDYSNITSTRSSSQSHPIVIDPPKLKKANTTSVATPPEPLSARGDLPGGYFPLHEDPKGRIHRPHPFFHESSLTRHQRKSDSITMQAERARISHLSVTSPMAHSSTPVSSYIAPGFQDAPVSMGKYYPSNYEHEHPQPDVRSLQPPCTADDARSSVKSDSHVPQHSASPTRTEISESEMRRKMQQYQRDMIAQATMALGSSAKSTTSLSLNGLPIKDTWITGSSPHKPRSPRLDPLGSPGPVTPMELESAGSSYLEKGKSPVPPFSKDSLSAPRAGLTARPF